jgi:hypothetical protein
MTRGPLPSNQGIPLPDAFRGSALRSPCRTARYRGTSTQIHDHATRHHGRSRRAPRADNLIEAQSRIRRGAELIVGEDFRAGRMIRPVNRGDQVSGDRMSEKAGRKARSTRHGFRRKSRGSLAIQRVTNLRGLRDAALLFPVRMESEATL